MPREIVLDTETTGLYPKDGHRVIEIACVEVDECVPTGRTFHAYIHPQRPIDADAERVHGISLASLEGKPPFAEIAQSFLDFIGDAVLVAHNAPFDRSFINAELERLGMPPTHEERWVDTMAMAQKRFPGMYNSLDALCKRFKISLAEREKHGAMIDTRLLAGVYLELQGGRERGLDLAHASARGSSYTVVRVEYGARPRPLRERITAAERAAHDAFVAVELKAAAIWLRFAS
jgi:DNA polymerase-3 subunit epsilon